MTQLFVLRRPAERLYWNWFNKRSMLWMRVYKMVNIGNDDRWALTRGNKGEQGFSVAFFPTLGDLLRSLFDHEVDTLVERLDIPAMLLIAIAASEGDVA